MLLRNYQRRKYEVSGEKGQKKIGGMFPIDPTSMFQSSCQIRKFNLKKIGAAERGDITISNTSCSAQLVPGTSAVGNLTVLRMISVPRTTTSSLVTCAVPSNTLSPATLISMGGSILVYLSTLDSTSRINSGSMNCFGYHKSTKSWNPSVC